MKHQNAVYAGMLKSLDEGVGRVLAKLKDRGLDKNTIVIFASDNGGFIGIDKKSGQTVPATTNAPLRSGKGSCYEGGIRVPLIVHWPGVTTQGAVCREPVIVMDLLPTLLNATGIELPDDVTFDGLDLTPLLKDPGVKLDRESLHFHYPHYYSTTTPVSAVRSRDWKLLEYYEDKRVELFNLKEDLGETTNLTKEYPERTAQLRKQLQRWRNEVGAQEPRPNPEFRARKSESR
jgi:arylsulfatase A-like enzyme